VAREWLAALFGDPPARAAVRRLIMAGAVRIDGRALRVPAFALPSGARLEMTVRPDLVRRDAGPRALDPRLVLYEDDAVIALDKPPGLPTVATADPSRAHLAGLVQRFLESRGSGPVALGVHQRLDRDTSGVVLFVKDRSASAAVAAQFESRAVEKTYLALTVRPARLPPARWRADEAIGDGSEPGRPAITEFTLVEAAPRGLLVEARPRTGRKHQVRIHLAGAGLPILGDATYGGDAREAPRVMLHAARLALRHPVTGAPLVVTSPLPRDFQDALERIRGRAEAPGGRRGVGRGRPGPRAAPRGRAAAAGRRRRRRAGA
jgi:RluA family pseudouridine synthase